MSKFSEKLKRDEMPTAQDWEEHLLEVHRTDPGMSPDAFSKMRTIFGKNSYTLLAETIPTGPSQVLDLACGDGFLARYILDRVGPHGAYTGVDMSDGELARAQENVKDLRATFVEGKAQQLPIQDQSVDHVLCHMAFMLMTPVEPVVKEIARVLKPGGTFSAVIGGTPDDDLFKEVRRISVAFVTERFPGWPEARLGDSRVFHLDGLRELFAGGFHPPETLTDIHLEVDTTPEGLWGVMRNMYYVGILDLEAKEELRGMIIKFGHRHARFGRELHFEFPMKMFSVRRS